MLLGEAATGGEAISLTATLFDTRTGDLEARASVRGPIDSVAVLVPRLAHRLMTFDAALQ